MYTRRNIRWKVIFQFAWRDVIVFILWGVLTVYIFQELKQREYDCSIPLAPLGTIGVAVALYVGFKNNQSYDRYWEARKIWGGIVNVSRSFANQVLTFVSAHHSTSVFEPGEVETVQRTLIYRHLAWMHALRFQLRRKTAWGFVPTKSQANYAQTTNVDAMRIELQQLLPEKELTVACTRKNSATQILRLQGDNLRKVVDEQRLCDEFRLIALMDLITEMYALQGKCERIKNTPFPRQYAYFSNVFIYIFIALLPWGIVSQFSDRANGLIWLTVPLSVIISWIFMTMETVGDTSEDPFENFVNDVPMTALCRTIEIDLRQMLDETDIPPPIQPKNDILM